MVWRGPQSQGQRRDLAVPPTRRVLVGTPLGHAPRLPLYGAERLRAAYGLDEPAPPPLVNVFA